MPSAAGDPKWRGDGMSAAPIGCMARAIEIPDPEPFIHRNWRFQRVSWIAMAIVIFAALGGGLGRGPLARAQRRVGPVEVGWERVTRHGAPTSITLTLHRAERDIVDFFINASFLEAMKMDELVPSPRSMSIQGDRVICSISILDTPAKVRLSFRPDGLGLRRATVGVTGSSEVQLWMFVLP